mmetsp:Transcript_44520/g.110810  ORF Transcript_44520/g.110810 Transcript_44520/m.110810 type:complete len:157 (-) Transcript_44520:482-952(-)
MQPLIIHSVVLFSLCLSTSARPAVHRVPSRHDARAAEEIGVDVESEDLAANATTQSGLVVYFDMDETLVYLERKREGIVDERLHTFDHIYSSRSLVDEEDITGPAARVGVRKDVIPFLMRLKHMGVRMMIWTAGTMDYADYILDALEWMAGGHTVW